MTKGIVGNHHGHSSPDRKMGRHRILTKVPALSVFRELAAGGER